jgi:hypothetical protein
LAIGDVVLICAKPNTVSGVNISILDVGNCNQLLLMGEWDTNSGYSVNSVVTYQRSSYVSDGDCNKGNNPASSPSNWTLLVEAGSNGTSGSSGKDGSSGTSGISNILNINAEYAQLANQTIRLNTATPLSATTTIYENGITAKNSSTFEVSSKSQYQLSYSAQIERISGSTTNVSFWVVLNGSNVDYTRSTITLDSNNLYQLPLQTHILDLSAGDELQVYASHDTAATEVRATYIAAAGTPDRPAAPSVTISIKQVGIVAGGTSGTSGSSGFAYWASPVETKNSGYNILTSDVGKTFTCSATTTQTFNLPSVDSTNIGYTYTIVKLGTGQVTIDAADSDTIEDSGAGDTIYCADETPATITLRLFTSTGWYIIAANGTWITTD